MIQIAQKEILTDIHVSTESQRFLEKYYLLHWTPEYLSYRQRAQFFTHQDVDYIPIYILDKKKPDGFHRVSFRKSNPGIGLPPVVIIGV
jgi:hypothetical protein